MPKSKKSPDEIAKALNSVNLTWRSLNRGYHWKVDSLALDIWPTRWKTMHSGQVREWRSMEAFSQWLAEIKDQGKPEAPYPKPSRRPIQMSLVREDASPPAKITGEQFNEADWEAFRRSGLLPW